jgi:hypothetical protein
MFKFLPNLVQLSSSLQKEKNMNAKLKLCTKYLIPYNMTKKSLYDAPLKQSFIQVNKHMAYAW